MAAVDTRLKPGLLIGLVFALALGVRAFHLNIPFLEPFNNYSRQSMCASVARNFYAHGFHLFYPEIDESGAGPSLYNVELPLHAYLMAWGYRITGGVHEWAARAVSVGFAMGFLVFLYRLTRRLADEATARWALLFAALSPMSVALSRSIQPDIAMLCLGTGALDCFERHVSAGRKRFLILSAVLLTAAVLLRPYALYFLGPMIFLAWRKEGLKCFQNPRYYFLAGCAGLALLWYFRMWWMGKHLQLAYSPYHPSTATAGYSFLDFLKPANLTLPGKAVFLHLLTPAGTLLCWIGIRTKHRRPGPDAFFGAWLAATILYLLLVWQTAVVHPYYFLPLSGPLAYFVARGAETLRTGAGHLSAWVRHPVFLSLTAALVCWNLAYYYRLIYFVPADRTAVVEAGAAVDRTAAPADLVVAAYGSSPIQLYYTHRHGWTLDLSESDEMLVRRMEEWRAEGAAYFVTTELQALAQRPALTDWLSRSSRLVSSGRFAVYRIVKNGTVL